VGGRVGTRVASAGLTAEAVARLAGVWGPGEAESGVSIGSNVESRGPRERMDEGLSMGELDWLLQQRGSRAWQDGHRQGYTAMREQARLSDGWRRVGRRSPVRCGWRTWSSRRS
jgi:hypothetical protein